MHPYVAAHRYAADEEPEYSPHRLATLDVDTSNWSEVERYGNGEPVRGGDVVDVKWLDGTETTEYLFIESRPTTYSDHGKEYASTDERTYIEVEYHGSPVRVYLRRSGIKVRKLAPDEIEPWRGNRRAAGRRVA